MTPNLCFRSDAKLCDIEELNKQTYDLIFTAGPPTCSINSKSEVDCVHGYQLTSTDCEIMSCSGQDTKLRICIGLLVILGLVGAGVALYYRKTRATIQGYYDEMNKDNTKDSDFHDMTPLTPNNNDTNVNMAGTRRRSSIWNLRL